MYFVIRRNASGQFWFRITSGNHEVLAHSEMYVSKQGAQNAIDAVQREAKAASILDMTDEVSERPQ